MGWATRHIEQLKQGRTVKVRPHGGSMSGRIESGQLCTIIPINEPIDVGDIVLCKVNGSQYLHLVKAIRGKSRLIPGQAQYQIGNNKGRINGWIRASSIYGKCIKVER